jgi:uncharacterized protein (DUF2236 family)
MTKRPTGVDAGRHTSDDGFYGPDTVTWRVMAASVTGLSATAAAMIQMLYPPVMYVIDQASGVRADPERRAKRTGDYNSTITYGDRAAAERAGEMLRRVHATRTAVDPSSGANYRADDPELLVWVHNTLTWTLLRGYRQYGPQLTSDEEDQFVAEQRQVAARLVGCDLADVAATVADLDGYMADMAPRLAMTAPALWFKDMVLSSGAALSADAVVKKLLVQAAVLLMSEEQQSLYGISLNRWQAFIATRTTGVLLSATESRVPIEKAIPQLREYVDTHAFGARRVRQVDPQSVAAEA